MKKIAIRSSSNLEKALKDNVQPYWYSVLQTDGQVSPTSEKNPWNEDVAELEKTVYLVDDCVLTIRPARYALKNDGAGDYEKDHYFLEISNQDGSSIFSSNRVYSWEDVNNLAIYFKGLSFTAATRIWKSKKI
ncbi:MAG: hypothetical protein ACRER8_13490 [Pseudomonas sp.]|uniref:hypothetical protein n=1 Tax=Pseudomonas sp. TaxID=306 RepID=UPI003D6E99D1